jgi:hypothetical protein
LLANSVDSAAQPAAARASRPQSGIRGTGRLLVGLLALAACASAPPAETTILSKSRGAESLVLLPLNVTAVMPSALEASSPVVYEALEQRLRAQGAALKTVSFVSARKLWLESIREARSGPRGAQAGFDDAAAIFVQRLAKHADFDAVIVASLFEQRASIEGSVAQWDGVERELSVEIGRRIVKLPPDAEGEGNVPAASLHVVVLDGDGARLHEKQAGLALTSRIRMSESATTGPTYRFVPLADPFSDPEQVVAGVALALSPYIPERTPKP